MTQFTPPTGTHHVYDYTFADGTPAFKVCRRDANGTGKKSFRQFSPQDGAWVAKQLLKAGTQPLYGLQALAAAPTAPVLMVEGEKAAAGARQYLPEGWLVTTWAGGSGNVRGPDVAPLDGRKVVIWPDNDEAGRICAAAFQERIPHARVVTVPVQFPEKWDLADALPEGFDAAWVRELIIHTADNKSLGTAAKNLPSTLNGHDRSAATAPQDQLTSAANRPVLLVDSDTTAVIANQYLPPGWGVAVYDPGVKTSLGSATHAVIWGRNDEGGRAWADAVAETLMIPSHVVALKSLPPHWHLGDRLPAGRSKAMLTKYLADAIARCQAAPVATLVAGGGTSPPVSGKSLRGTPAAPTQAPPAVVTGPPQDQIDLPFIRSGARGDGSVKPIMQNAAMLLQANPQRWDLRFNEFSHRTCLGKNPITDHQILVIAQWVQQCGVHASTNTISEAINAVAGRNPFHPVRDYLDPLVWDEIPRLDMLFIDHAGTPDTALTRAVTARWFIQAVARIYQPGCQADTTLVLEGNQGLRKSSFFRELFGDQWFTDHLPDLTSKDALIQLRGVWCVEIAELATLGRADIKKINQFLTSRVDRYRDPYGRVVADFPRTCVFSGTVNPGAGGYLKDETGARRFWPVNVQDVINIGAIYQNRDQIWAEALARYRAREAWYLGEQDLTQAAQAATLERFASDPWQGAVDSFLKGRTEVAIEEIFRDGLKMDDMGKWSQLDMGRVARCLAFAGWIRVSRGPRKWVYVPEGSEAAQSALL